MKILRNTDIAKIYGVSNPSVFYWLQDAKDGKNNLELAQAKGKFYVIDNRRNQEELQRLFQLGRNKLSKAFKKDIVATNQFLSFFDPDQLIEFISDLEKGEINEKFSYFDNEGAKNWDAIYQSEASNLQSNSYFLLRSLYNWIKPYLGADKQYNIFDVGPGNGLPILDFLKPLNSDQKLAKYYAIDISPTINDITRDNIEANLPGVFGESLVLDIENARFSSYFYQKIQNNIANIIFFIGGTISNVTDRTRVFKNIQSGMTKDDFLVFTFSLDTPQNRMGVNYVLNEESDNHQNWLPKLLGIEIDPSKNRADYNPEGYKYKTFKVEKDYNITFKIFDQDKTILLPRGLDVVTWRHYLITMTTIETELNNAGLDLVNFSKDLSGQTGMIIARVR
jgi:uncharacterized SAM-dependent methyltransferase